MTKRKAKRRRRARARRGSSRIWPYLLLATLGLIAVVAVAIVVTRPAASPPATPASAVPQSDTGHEAGELPYPEVPRVSVAEAKARYDAGTALFVDTRSQKQYDLAHISNAISLPVTDVEARYRELPRDAEIITY